MASYKKGVLYIALNDEPYRMSAEEMSGYASVHVLAEVFDKNEMVVAEDVIHQRTVIAKRLGRAIRTIELRKQVCFDVAAEHGQIFDNVKHLSWFIEKVAENL